jgi:DNA-binding NtrC family response regulator
MFQMPMRLLLVDADAARSARVTRLGRALGWDVARAGTAADGIARLGSSAFDLCFIDLALPPGEGSAVVLKARACQPPVVAAAFEGALNGCAVEALRVGATEIVAAPRRADDLKALAARLLDRYVRNAGAPRVVGDDPALARALGQLDGLASCDRPALIRGETGTGKATMARLLHASSPRRAGRFVAINLAAVPLERAEAQLARRPLRGGWLAAARGGTLFLDELDLLSPRAQAALLWRLRRPRTKVRLVGATRHDLDGLVERGVLDRELAACFAGAAIELPPLRARRADVPALAEHFRRQVNAREGRRVPGFALDVMRRFSQHDWPGNVRELQNLVERLVITAGTRMVVMKDLPTQLRIEVLDFERAAQERAPDGIDPRRLLAELEARFIAEAMGATGDEAGAGMNRADRLVSNKPRRRFVA